MTPIIRQASEDDIPVIGRIVYAAYQKYISRIGKMPGPMTDDYRAHVRSGNLWVLALDDAIVGLLVLVPKSDHMLLDNVAVIPERQALGLGRHLINFAEARARECGYSEIRLYTNELMHENISLYSRLGYQVISRHLDAGFNRVFMKKAL